MKLSFTAEQIAAFLSGEVRGDGQRTVSDVSKIEESVSGTLCFLGEQKYVRYLATASECVVLISKSLDFNDIPTRATLIVVDNARGAMAQLLKMVADAMYPRKQGIESPAYISDGVEVTDDCYIGAFTYIGKGAKIGKGVQIYPQCYIGDGAVIGDYAILYAGVKVYAHCQIGKNCILHSGVVIGADGFGFEPDANGINQKVPQIGNVIIEDDVEIGANTTIDRAMMGSTIVQYNAKIDNLVQVAHNVQIGKSTFLCAQVGIAGSSTVGEHCILTGQTGVAGHIKIADRCIFGAQSGIAGNVPQAGMYQGYPAIPAATWRRSTVVFKNLNELQKKVYELEKQVNKLSEV